MHWWDLGVSRIQSPGIWVPFMMEEDQPVWGTESLMVGRSTGVNGVGGGTITTGSSSWGSCQRDICWSKMALSSGLRLMLVGT